MLTDGDVKYGLQSLFNLFIFGNYSLEETKANSEFNRITTTVSEYSHSLIAYTAVP